MQELLNSLANDDTVVKFKVLRPVECSRLTFNGLPACSAIYQFATKGEEGKGLSVTMIVKSLGPNGEDFESWYRGGYKDFNHYLPTVESMLKSFKTKEDYSIPADEDFKLEEPGGNLNLTNTTSMSNMSVPTAINSTG